MACIRNLLGMFQRQRITRTFLRTGPDKAQCVKGAHGLDVWLNII